MSLPDDVFEWIGKAVRQSVDLEKLRLREESSADREKMWREYEGAVSGYEERVNLAVQKAYDAAANVKDGEDGRDGENGKDGRDGVDGKDGANGLDGKDGAPGERGAPGEPGQKGEKGEPGETDKSNRDFSDEEFFRRVHSALDQTQVPVFRHDRENRGLEFIRTVELMRDAVVGAVREAPAPVVNVTVPMPRKGKEIMRVEQDDNGRILRTIKEEVD